MTTPATEKRATEALYSPELFSKGIGQVVVSRFKSSGAAEVGVFLVDVYCLGVKNGFFRKTGPEDHEALIQDLSREEEMISVSPACARKLVEGAVAYAARLGLRPHRDYKLASRVLGGIKSEDCDQEFTFGSDGKPFYIQGPNDSPAFAESVRSNLEKRCGGGGYDFLVVA